VSVGDTIKLAMVVATTFAVIVWIVIDAIKDEE
jgi:hypothetical protein